MFFRESRINVGTGGGDDNYQLITGAVSEVRGNAGGNSWIGIGMAAGSTGNSLRVEAGGTVNFGGTGTGTTRRWAVGEVLGADNNYISITGANSTANLVHTGMPLAIGGYGNGGTTLADGGTGNRLDVHSGGSLNMVNTGSNANIVTGSTALVLLGTNSAFNLGNGTGLSTATIGTTTGFSGLAEGVYIKNADGRLNFNSGKLIAGAAGDLVSGAGKVVLNGAATISTTQIDSLISTVIEGSTAAGTLSKEGSGTLILNQANTYIGNTTIKEGTLKLDLAGSIDSSAVITVGDAPSTGTVLYVTTKTGGFTLGGTVAQTLKGKGTVSGMVTIGSMGTLSPGNSIESIDTGSITFNNNSTYAYELTTATIDGDLVNAAVGSLTLSGTVALTLTDLGASTVVAPGAKLSLISYNGTWNNGTFNGYANDSTFTLGANSWTINYDDTTGGANVLGGGTGSAFVTITAAIPEPTISILTGLGVVLIAVRRRQA